MMSGEMQPVVMKDHNVMFTTCSGVVEDWSSCNIKAGKACANGYEVLDKTESPVGGRRDLTFSCK